MSSEASCDQSTITAHNVNARIDSAFANDPARRGSLAANELDSIHQSASYKQAQKIQDGDNRELRAKIKQLQRKEEAKKQ